MTRSGKEPSEDEGERALADIRARKASDDADDLLEDEVMGNALDAVAEARANLHAKEERRRANLDLPTWDLGVMGPLTRHEIYEDVLCSNDDPLEEP